jgi:hypothetical protein
MLHNTSKTTRPLEAERTSGIANEEDGTLEGLSGFEDGFFYHRLNFSSR